MLRICTLVALSVCLPYVSLLHAQPVNYPDACISNVDNATVVIPQDADLTLENGTSLAAQDTLALRDSDGDCVGYGVWNDDGTDLALSAAGSASIDEASSGYTEEASLSYEAYDASKETLVDLGDDVAYAACDTLAVAPCRDDGSYADGVVFVVEALQKSEMPVELASFSASRTEERALLKWTTAQEQSNAGFEVQHRRKDASASSWTSLQFIEGTGTTTEPTTYSLKTEPLAVGTHQFRLRQVDHDGTASLSSTVSVDLTLDEPYRIRPVSPNPVRRTAQLSITVKESQRVRVSMYNVLGQQVATLHDRTIPANDTQNIQVQGHSRPSGVYLLQVEGEQFSDAQRMTVVR